MNQLQKPDLNKLIKTSKKKNKKKKTKKQQTKIKQNKNKIQTIRKTSKQTKSDNIDFDKNIFLKVRFSFFKESYSIKDLASKMYLKMLLLTVQSNYMTRSMKPKLLVIIEYRSDDVTKTIFFFISAF